MTKTLAAFLMLVCPALSSGQDLPQVHREPKPAETVMPANAGVLNLSCMEALAAVEHADMAGVFSFIAEKDAPAAFADFLSHNKAAMRRYVEKLDADLKGAAGVTPWDHEVVMRVLDLYNSPLAETAEKLPEPAKKRLQELSAAPTLSLEEISERRKAR